MTIRRTFCRNTARALAAALLTVASASAVCVSAADDTGRMPTTLLIPETISPGTVIGCAAQPGSLANGYRFVGENALGLFTIDGDTGVIRTDRGAEFDYERCREFVLTVAAAEPHSTEEPLFDDFRKSLMEAAVQASRIDDLTRREVMLPIVVRLLDVPEPPVISDQVLSVCERTVDGTPVGNVVAVDADSSDSLRFFIVAGNHQGVFGLDPDTGVLQVVQSALLGHESQKQHELRVRVQDSAGLTNEATVLVHVTDKNEPPVLRFEFPAEPADDRGVVIGTIVATDPEGRGPVFLSIDEEAEDIGVRLDPFTGVLVLTRGVGPSGELPELSNLQILATDADGITAGADIAVDPAALLKSSLQEMPAVAPDVLADQREGPEGTAVTPAAAARDSGPPRQMAFLWMFLAGLIAATTFAVIRIRSVRDANKSMGPGYSRKLTLSEAVRLSVNREKAMQFPSEQSHNSSAVADVPGIRRLSTVAAGAGTESSRMLSHSSPTDHDAAVSADRSAPCSEALRLRHELSELFGTPFDPAPDSSFPDDQRDNSLETSDVSPAFAASVCLDVETNQFGESEARPAWGRSADDEHRSFVDDYMSRLVGRVQSSATESSVSVTAAAADRDRLPVLPRKSQDSDARPHVVSEDRDHETQDSAVVQYPEMSAFVCATAPSRVAQPNIDRDQLRHSMVSFRAVAAQSIEQAIASHGRLAARRSLSGRRRLLLSLVIMLGLSAGITAMQVMDLGILSATLGLAVIFSSAELSWRMHTIRKRPLTLLVPSKGNSSAEEGPRADRE